MPASGNFNLIVNLIYPNNSSDGRLRELFVMECWNSPDQGENTIVEPARDSTNRAIGTVLQLDPGCFRNFIRRLLFAVVHVNRHLSLLCQCSSPTLRSHPFRSGCLSFDLSSVGDDFIPLSNSRIVPVIIGQSPESSKQ